MDKLKIYAKTVEDSAMSQIEEMSHCEAYKDCIIRIMPDCCAGKGCTIGTVIEVKDPIVPNSDYGACSSCCFRGNMHKGACAMLACHSDEREDGKEVVFERI